MKNFKWIRRTGAVLLACMVLVLFSAGAYLQASEETMHTEETEKIQKIRAAEEGAVQEEDAGEGNRTEKLSDSSGKDAAGLKTAETSGSSGTETQPGFFGEQEQMQNAERNEESSPGDGCGSQIQTELAEAGAGTEPQTEADSGTEASPGAAGGAEASSQSAGV